MDWYAAKQEYITTDTSYRKLAEKYGISRNELGKRATKEGWVAERRKWHEKTLSKTLNALGTAQAQRAAKLQTVADKLLSKIESAVDNLPDDSADTQQYRQIAASLKDIKDIQMIRSEADMREQEARIANLQKQANKDEDARQEIVVRIEGGDLEDFSK